MKKIEDILYGSIGEAIAFISWMADGPCQGNGSGLVCCVNAPKSPTWCCPRCRAFLIYYGPPTAACSWCGEILGSVRGNCSENSEVRCAIVPEIEFAKEG